MYLPSHYMSTIHVSAKKSINILILTYINLEKMHFGIGHGTKICNQKSDLNMNSSYITKLPVYLM